MIIFRKFGQLDLVQRPPAFGEIIKVMKYYDKKKFQNPRLFVALTFPGPSDKHKNINIRGLN